VYLWEKYRVVKNYLKLLVLALLPATVLAQTPEFSVYGGLPIFISDKESAFGAIGGTSGIFDGYNFTSGAEVSVSVWNRLSVFSGLDIYSIRANNPNISTQLNGFSPKLGLTFRQVFDEVLIDFKGSMGLGFMRTLSRTNSSTIDENPGLYTLESLSTPASLGVRGGYPIGKGIVFVELTYRYFMFDDGLDGMGGGGTRIGGHDDQMLIGVAGYTWNLSKFQTRSQRELVQTKKAAEMVPVLKRQNEELKIAQAELEDELEVVKSQKLKLEQRVDSIELGLKPATMAGANSGATETATGSRPASSTQFVVVIGSFRSDRLAAQYVNRLKVAGVNCSTSEGSNGFVRVYTGPFRSEQAALDALAKVRVETPGAWLLRL
jgi:hypothetical protein